MTFNLDEYWPMPKDSIHSYHRFMRETFFDHVNIPPENIHIPDGTIPLRDVDAFCEAYEHAIEKAGGIDLQILGIGRTGHIGFNEPGSPRDSRTRMVTLDPVTRQDAASDFYGEENVPQQAITMGVGTILAARKIIIIALGEHKAPIVRRALEEPQSRRGDRQLSADAPQRDVRRRSGERVGADGDPHAVARRPGALEPGDGEAGRHLAQSQGQEAVAQARGPRFRLESTARFAPRVRPDRSHSAAGLRGFAERDLHAARRRPSGSGSSSSARIPTTT